MIKWYQKPQEFKSEAGSPPYQFPILTFFIERVNHFIMSIPSIATFR
jgi:hypothetical protein